MEAVFFLLVLACLSLAVFRRQPKPMAVVVRKPQRVQPERDPYDR